MKKLISLAVAAALISVSSLAIAQTAGGGASGAPAHKMEKKKIAKKTKKESAPGVKAAGGSAGN